MRRTPAAASLLLLAPLAAQAAPPALVVRCDQPGHAIPATLFGIFFEEINHAGEGGLWAQLVRNPTFEEPGTDADPLPGWSLRVPEDGDASLRAATDAPAHAATPRHALVELRRGGTCALCNRGHFGVPLREGEEYECTATIRCEGTGLGMADRFEADVVDATDHVVWQAELRSPGRVWNPVSAKAKATATLADGTLRIHVRGEGRAEIDTVTLRPTRTWKDHGLRIDLAEKLAALHPAFVRFPGGCFVEGGDHLADAFRWQATLGPLQERPGHRNTSWNYWSSDGLGYHEYLQLCEDLGALPLFVVNCGMSHRDTVPMGDLDPWVQSALDAIEYSNGDATTTWGRRRAANGHPAPFGLRFVEIGNENGMFRDFGGTRDQYAERYERFRSAIAAKWPTVQLIADTRVPHPMQIVDDHFYMSSAWFWSEADRYRKADRGGPRVYVGEYAVTQDPGRTGNLRAALGECAFLFGLQRDSDVVTMASYAPLFVHVMDRKWNPDAIQFDGLRCAGTPSYWMQTMLAAHRPDVLLPVDVPAFQQDAVRGSVGVGTWNTQAEFKDLAVEVDGAAVWRSDFAQGSAGEGAFRHESGKWQIVDGALRQSEGGELRWTWTPHPSLRALADYTVRCKARKLGGAEGFLLMFHVAGAGDWTWFNVGGWGNTQHALERSSSGGKWALGRRVAGSVETGRWYDLRVECKEGRIRCFVDDALVLDEQDRNPPDFAAVAGRAGDGAVVLEVCNGSNVPRLSTIDLRAAGPLQPVADGQILLAPGLDAENTLEQPENVAPKPLRVDGVGAAFAHKFPPRSLTILRFLPAK